MTPTCDLQYFLFYMINKSINGGFGENSGNTGGLSLFCGLYKNQKQLLIDKIN